MANQVIISPLNPIRFYNKNEAQFPQYLTRHFNDYPYKDTILRWQEKIKYFQKWQTSDTTFLQFQSNFQPLQIDVLDWRTSQPVTTLVANLQIPNTGAQPGFFVYQFALSWAGIPEGCYTLKLSNGSTDLDLISEPIHLAATHPDTVSIEYTNSRYFLDIIFETLIEFSFRVEGSFGALQPGAYIQAYEDQRVNPRILSAKPYRVKPLTIGGTFGVPDWVADLFNVIWCCDSVSVDGKGYARDGESELEFKSEDDYPMRGLTLNLKEGSNRMSKVVSPDLDTTQMVGFMYQIETNFFGDLSSNSSSNQVPILLVDF